jgi:serine/threonine protein kinase
MSVRIEPHSEPIPGYRLIERLGGGGFGEVWKAEAPGGLYKAIKFVYGDMESGDDDEDGSRAEQELKALNRVKTVHHPYILSLERFDITDGQLMIVMELADRTLWDRFKECRAQGLPGIPRAELLGYLRETAEALDLMNDQFQLQHLDIKPQNLFLVFNHVKVADFGLVKDLGNKAAATITGGVTPVYAAPETFDGWLSRFSDQYSLAIVYQELLTGQRPFSGATMRQLVLQHLQGEPDLTPLPAADRVHVARALSKQPDHRFPSCLEFVDRLWAATPRAPDSAPETPALPGVTELPDPGNSQPTLEARGAGLGPWRSSEPEDEPAPGRPQVLPARPYREVTLSAPGAGAEGESARGLPGQTIPAVRRAGASAAELQLGGTGRIQPALVVGLGGMALGALAQLRRRLTNELALPDELPHVRLLAVDTDPEALQAAGAGEPGEHLLPGECYTARLYRPTHYVKARDGKVATESWLNGRLVYRIPRGQASAGLRPLGRLAFVDNFRAITRRLETELRACADAASQPPARDPLAPRGPTPRVYVVTCLGGNTGSGMFLDVAFVVRNHLRRLGHASAEVIGLFFVPPAEAAVRPAALANTYAALTELNYYCQHPFVARFDSAEPQSVTRSLRETGSPFHRCVVFELPGPGGTGTEPAAAQTQAAAGEFLYRDLATPLGPSADEQRRRRLLESGPAALLQAGPTFHTVGEHRLSWPRQPLLEKGARRTCRRLVDSWAAKDARPVAEAIAGWVAETWDALGLRPEGLIARLHKRCQELIGQPPENLVTAVTGPLAEAVGARPGKPAGMLNFGPAVAALAELERLLAVPEECRPPHQPPGEPGRLEAALSEAAERLADECEQRLAEQVVRLIEDPRFRLAGAEEALRQLSAAAERALQSQETLARELSERAALLYRNAHRALENPVPVSVPAATTTSGWKLTFGRRTPDPANDANAAALEVLEVIRQYPKTRYHALVLQNINRLYVGLRGQLSDQLREVGFCRQRLSELAGLLNPSAAPPEVPPDGLARVLLPAGCRNLDEALVQLDNGVNREDLIALDHQVQAMIRQQFRALVQVCMGPSTMVRALAPAMLQCAREFLLPRFGGTSVSELFLNRRAGGEAQPAEHALKEMQDLYDRAAAKNAPAGSDADFAVAVLPDDPKGRELQGLLRERLPHLYIITADRPDEIVFYREQIFLTSTSLPQFGPVAQEAYRQRLAADPAAVHTREDIAEWQPLVSAGR